MLWWMWAPNVLTELQQRKQSFSLTIKVNGTDLCWPDVDALVEATWGQVLAVGREGDAVHGLGVFSQGVDAKTSLYVP